MEWTLSIIAFILLIVFNYIYKRDKASIEDQYKEEIREINRKHSEEINEWTNRMLGVCDERNKYHRLYSLLLITETFDCSPDEAQNIYELLDAQSYMTWYLRDFLEADTKEKRVQIYETRLKHSKGIYD